MIDQYFNNLLKGAHSASNPADRVVPTRAARFRAVVRPSYYNAVLIFIVFKLIMLSPTYVLSLFWSSSVYLGQFISRHRHCLLIFF